MTRPMPGPPEHNMNTAQHGGDWRWACAACDAEALSRSSRAPRKRLSDAECAAHAWQTSLGWMRPDIGRDMGFPSDGMKYEIWHRFATHPHALEES